MKGQVDAATTWGNARWIAISQGVRLTAQLIGLAIFSRLLAPSDFGLLAMALVVTNLAYVLRDMGTASAVIQSEALDEVTKATVFYLNLVFSLGVGLIVVALSPLAARMFKADDLVPVLGILALSLPVTGVTALHQALLERESSFRSLAWIEGSSAILGLGIGLGFAFQGAGVYALVAQTLSNALFSSVQLWWVCDWRPRTPPRWDAFVKIRKFSGFLVAFNFINYFSRNADSLLIGRFLGAAPLGVYSLAYRIMLFPVQNLTFVANRALYPVLSRQQSRPEEMRKTYLRSVEGVASLTAPLMAGVWVLREDLVGLALGGSFASVAGLLAWLAPTGFVQSVNSTTGIAFKALGRTDTLFRLGVLALALFLAAFLIGVQYDLQAVVALYLVANVINAIVSIGITQRMLSASISSLLAALGSSAISAGVMVVALLGLGDIVAQHVDSALIRVLTLTLTGAAIYGAMMVIVFKKHYLLRGAQTVP